MGNLQTCHFAIEYIAFRNQIIVFKYGYSPPLGVMELLLANNCLQQ